MSVSLYKLLQPYSMIMVLKGRGAEVALICPNCAEDILTDDVADPGAMVEKASEHAQACWPAPDET